MFSIHRAKRTSTLVAGTAVLVLLSACSQSADVEVESSARHLDEANAPLRYRQDVDVGVSYLEPESPQVVHLESGYQHVLLPEGAERQYSPEWNNRELAVIAERLEGHELAMDEVPEDDDQPGDKDETRWDEQELRDEAEDVPEDEADQRVRDAWEKYCEGRIDEMTEGDWFIIQSTDMPESFAPECSPPK